MWQRPLQPPRTICPPLQVLPLLPLLLRVAVKAQQKHSMGPQQHPALRQIARQGKQSHQQEACQTCRQGEDQLQQQVPPSPFARGRQSFKTSRVVRACSALRLDLTRFSRLIFLPFMRHLGPRFCVLCQVRQARANQQEVW